MRKKRAVTLSLAAILLCMCLIVGGTYALYTDEVRLRNHLQAGNLDLTLVRTDLIYTVLNDKTGYMEEKQVPTDKDFSASTNDNIFGFERGSSLRMVPGSYFRADLTVGRAEESDVAFDCFVELRLLESSDSAFAKQLLVSITDPDGQVLLEEISLAELLGEAVFLGRVALPTDSYSFSVRVEFSERADNNDARAGDVWFDLVVSAVQATEKGSD